MRTYVYVDGFNLYYGALKGTTFRWLNLVELAKQLVPTTHTIDKVKYFTARVSGAVDPQTPVRQHAYLLALSTLPNVEIYYGRFLAKNIWRPITNFPTAGATIHSPPHLVPLPLPLVCAAGDYKIRGGSLGAPATLQIGTYPAKGTARKKKTTSPLSDALIAEVHTMEEKGSDVCLAAHLLNDAWKGVFDEAVVISNDTDLVEPIRMVSVEQAKPVLVVCPGRWTMAPDLAKVASFKAHTHLAMLRKAQFQNPIPGTAISKPAGW